VRSEGFYVNEKSTDTSWYRTSDLQIAILFTSTENIYTYILIGMERDYRAEIRFRFYHYCFHVGGVPLFHSFASSFYRVYSLLCHVCVYVNIMAMFLDIYCHTVDVDHAIYVAMIFLLFLGGSFTQLYFR